MSPYVNESEEKIDHYLKGLSANSNPERVRKKIQELLQADAITFQIWCEHHYKAYASLTKEQRLGMYTNLDSIRSSFQSYSFMQVPDVDSIFLELTEKDINTNNLKSYSRQLQYLKQITSFFNSQVVFHFQQPATFAGFIKDPKKSMLRGDYHQIISLYTYLYSLKYEVADLKIKAMPGHICLHFEGVDIEATTGTFEKYSKEIQEILPITELVVISLLDIPDGAKESYEIPATSLIEAARLAFLLSERKDVVTHNLKVAFRKIIIHLLETNNFETALTYALASKDQEAVHHAALKGTSFYLNKEDFVQARKFSGFTKDRETIRKKIDEREGIALYNKKEYFKAIDKFKDAGHSEFEKKCYVGLFFREQSTVKDIKYISLLKEKRKTLLKMKFYAEKAEDEKLKRYAAGMLRQIGQK